MASETNVNNEIVYNNDDYNHYWAHVRNTCVSEIVRRRIAAAAAALVALHVHKKKKRRTKWSQDWLLRRNDNKDVLAMVFSELRSEDPRAFRNFSRMEVNTLDALLEEIRPFIEKQHTVMREAIPARDRLAVTLRFLATGNSLTDLAYSTRIAQNTLSQIIPEVLEAIVRVLQNKVMKFPCNVVEWEEIAMRFSTMWQFPHCIGAIDGKHINFRPLRSDGSLYRNYKGTDSIILLALVDANYQFLYVDIGRNGRMHDAAVFRDSSLAELLYSEGLNLPEPCHLPGSADSFPYVITADDAFPLKVNILKPYPGQNLSVEKKVFNYRLSRARRLVENALGILANRFRILLSTMNCNVMKVELITLACVLLHNYLCQTQGNDYIPDQFKGGHGQSSMHSISNQRGNRCSNAASSIRDRFCQYFNTVGAVPWQERAVEKGNF